ncbi:MAG: hypothetical protein J6D47_14465 [Peptostreptococcaceae bacterium]|nr:hypothetical protein [Peptostreptococcaceae bacterium]
METNYEIVYLGNGEIDFINRADTDEEFLDIDDMNQENQLIENGTLCSNCGELNVNLIGEDKILKTPSGRKYICDKCTGGNK